MRHHSCGWFMLVVLWQASNLWAQLTWESTHMSREVPAGSQSASTNFKLENTGQYPLTILSIESLDPQVSVHFLRNRSARLQAGPRADDSSKIDPFSQTLRPGAKGEVTVSVRYKTILEPKTWQVRVVTDEVENDTTVLRFTVMPAGWQTKNPADQAAWKKQQQELLKQPLPLVIVPAQVHWMPTDGMKTKVIDVKAGTDQPVVVKGLKPITQPGRLGMQPMSPAFETELKTIEAGRHYQIHITPKAQAQPQPQPQPKPLNPDGKVPEAAARMSARMASMRHSATSWELEVEMTEPMLQRQRLTHPMVIRASVFAGSMSGFRPPGALTPPNAEPAGPPMFPPMQVEPGEPGEPVEPEEPMPVRRLPGSPM